jgi:hypothetical protein
MFSRILAEADSALKLRGGARADDAQLFLSWNAPWGERRAQRVRMPACADSMREDTLYLSFQAGRSSERFSGFTGSIYLRATGSDTLGSWWHTDSRTGENPGSLRMEWSSAEGFPGRNPWHAAGQGFLILTRTPQAAHLRMVFAVPYEEAGPVVPNAIYALGRIIFKHHPERALAGCAQPVVVEWGTATLAFGPKDEPAVSRGERFVTWGGPITLAEAFKSSKVVVWRPKQPAAK